MKEFRSLTTTIDQEKEESIQSIKRRLFSLYQQTKSSDNNESLVTEIKELENKLANERECYQTLNYF